MIGQMLAHYEVVSQLGKGGMGEVYKARDTKLGRDVALKLLPPELSRDQERLARFRREAKVLASLNHPSIAALFGIEEDDGRVLLVMELAAGQDLSHRLEKGAIPLQDAMAMALAITEGLEAAHAKSIVHRDLKPANVMLSDAGRIKLLDFGLARAFDNEDASGDPMMSPTITSAGMTAAGVILGTAAYMSPEQARGKTIGNQSDIWAFGALFFEMLTGHRLFEGETVSDSIGAILHKDPDWNLLPADTPPQIHQLLRRCLERDTDRRLRDIGDARVAIVDAQRDPSGSSMGLSGAMLAAPQKSKAWLAPVVGLVALAIGVFGGMQLTSDAPEGSYRVLDLGFDAHPTNDQMDAIQAAIAPDGHAVAFAHAGQIWLHDLGELEARPLDGSDDALGPFWSPDSGTLGWFKDGRLWKVPSSGGRPTAICEIEVTLAGGTGASWGDDGRILFGTGASGIFSVSAAGGQARVEVPMLEGESDLHEPWVLPNGGGVLYVTHPASGTPSILALWKNGEQTVLFDGGEHRVEGPIFDPAGFILFRVYGEDAVEGLWAIEFDAGSGAVSGEAFIVQPDVSEASIANDGTLIYLTNPRQSGGIVVSRIEPGSAREEIIVPPHSGEFSFNPSPDGSMIAFAAAPDDGGLPELWIRDISRGIESCITQMEYTVALPRWAPDSSEVFFSVWNLETRQSFIYRIPADGSRPPERVGTGIGMVALDDGSTLLTVLSAGRDGFYFAHTDSTDVWTLPLDGDTERVRVMGGDGQYFPIELTPDGNYLLYVSGPQGQPSYYLTRWPEIQGRWTVAVSKAGGRASISPDGSSIFHAVDGVVYEVSLDIGDAPVLGRPIEVHRLPDGADDFQLDAMGNFLITRPHSAPEAGSRNARRGIKYVQNWTRKLQGR